MKPEGAKELEVSADLSVFSCEQAIAMAEPELNPEILTRKDIFECKTIRGVIIRVASQNLNVAYEVRDRLFLPKSTFVSVDLDTGYDVDEWSVEVVEHKADGPSEKSIVWSPGA